MKYNITLKNITYSILITLILATTSTFAQEKKRDFEIPEGVIARLGNGQINDMQYTQDGTRLAVASSMGIWLYDTINFKEIYLLKKHKGNVYFMAFSPNGKTLASADGGGTTHFWDTDTGEHIRELKIFRRTIKIFYSADGDKLGILGTEGSVRLWDPITGTEMQVFDNIEYFSSRGFFSFDINPNNFMIATGGRRGVVNVLDPFTGKTEHTYEGHEGTVRTVMFSPDNKLIAAGDNQNIRIWDTESGEQKLHIDNIDGVRNLTFSPDGSLFACNKANGNILLFDTATGKIRKELVGHSESVIRIAFSSDLRTVASAAKDGSVRIWEVFSGEQKHIFEGHFGNFSCIDISPDGKTVLSPTRDKKVFLWDVTSAKVEKTFLKDDLFPYAEIDFNPSGTIIAGASYGNFLSVYDRKTGELLKTMKGHEDYVISVTFSPDGKTIVSGSSDKTVRLWNTDTWEEKMVLDGHEAQVTSVAFSPDGTMFASASLDTTVRLWDANTGAEISVIDGHAPNFSKVIFSPDGTTIVSVDSTPTIYLWDAGTAEQKKVIKSDEFGVHSVAFSPDGNVLATGNESGVVQLFDVGSGESLRKFPGHQRLVTDIEFTPDGNRLVSRCEEGILYVWDVAGASVPQ